MNAELDPQWIVLLILAFVFGFTVLGFTSVHLSYILRNETTIEHLADRPYDIRVDFDSSGHNFEIVSIAPENYLWEQSKRDNWRCVMGNHPLTWFVPIRKGLGDGIVFPYSDKIYQNIIQRAQQQRDSMNASYFEGHAADRTSSTETYFKSYPHPKVTQKSNLPRKLSANTHQNTPPTPIDTPKSQHLNHSLEDKIDFRFGPIELQAVNTTEKTIPLGYGVLHLYRDRQAMQEQDLPDTKIAKQESMKEKDDSDDDRIICILAVPSYMTNKDFMQFLGSSTNKDILQYRFIRDFSPNKYMVLLKFKNKRSAFACYQKYNGRRFNMMEPEISHAVYLQSYQIESYSIQSFPYMNHTLIQDLQRKKSDLAELPTCPVCLERMDESITGLLSIQCRHTVQCDCVHKWGQGKCPVCRYSQRPVLTSIKRKEDQEQQQQQQQQKQECSECFECQSTESLWICMICGHIGCGRYQDAHAYDHYVATDHLYALEIETQRVWDYLGDGYVHRLIQNMVDGAIVELPPNETGSSSHHRDQNESASKPNNNNNNSSKGNQSSTQLSRQHHNNSQLEKLDGISTDYTFMLISQLDSQRMYYEDQLDVLFKQKANLENEVQAVTHRLDYTKETQEKLKEKVSGLDCLLIESSKEKDRIDKKTVNIKDKYIKFEKNLNEEKANNMALKREVEEKEKILEKLSLQGTSADQDSRFSNKEKKLLKTMSFPPEFDQKVDMKKVNFDVINPWISNKITELLGFEDEVVSDYASSLLEEESIDPKMMQINLTGFLESNAKVFVKELWNLLLSAQNSVGGIPAIFIEQKKEELRKKRELDEQRRSERDSIMQTIRKRRNEERDDLRENRRSRFDQHSSSSSRRRSYSRSRSPPRRHRSREDRRRRDEDDYYHRHRDDKYHHRESRRSPKY
ncbi:hypothetical protein RO3G_12938 [Rhizopus delemar RA 99-880]|uniref:RING-type domain-containing protein n=1 Tax=Rhizopus delemar (strain RA 99-880 / ATCC MYA-4621 / FGSC 9543 / NRRL 43880) TaxID=246409 RepID=I1CIE7_RHIO9|nr:hypothetical protein RO3G_12938 [Rhizopus delemar RA 99-880]|eukprot:EIE88227.1 hypothetical protein RO3G_12938 [Rhizopus delemar RA 99-880]